MISEPIWWTLFGAFVLAMLALDLGVFHRNAHEVKVREAAIWTTVWFTLASVFCLGIWMGWLGPYHTPETQRQAALEFLTGYLIEVSLSVDNVFVFALLFTFFKVPPSYRHRVLFWGILGALVMRAAMIFAGVALIEKFHWVTYLLAIVLIIAGVKMWTAHGPEVDPEHSIVLRLARRIFRVSKQDHGSSFVVRENGVLMVTPLFIVLLLVEWTDLVFAVDSIPAVLVITQDAFIVFTSNVMAILGLRSLYFALAGAMDKFHLLHYGLAAILVFVGVKMLLASFFTIPTIMALGVVAAILVVAVVASLCTKPRVPVAVQQDPTTPPVEP
jgi:tellurite resistance protein TerC